MKKTLTVITILFLVPVLWMSAQTNQGQWLLGISSRYSLNPLGVGISLPDMATLGYSTIKTKSDNSGSDDSEPIKFFCLNMIPKAGYFVIDNLAVGLDLQLGMYSQKEKWESETYKDNGTMFSAGPFVRYYFPSGKMLPYIEASGTLGSIKTKSDDGSDVETDKMSVSSLSAGAGISVPLGDRVAFDCMLGYLSQTLKDPEDNDDNYRTVIGTIGLKFGVVVFLGKSTEKTAP